MSKKINLLETGNMLLAAQKIVLCCHVSPDGDTLGSALGLARLLEQKGKEVTVFVDDDINKSLSFIPGVDKVQRPEAGVIVESDLFVVVDASSFDRVGICNEVVKAPVLLNIDHHISNTEFADYLYLDAEAAAAGEIMCDLFEAMGWEYDEAIAVDFYTAITTDCGSFRYSNTTSRTMQRAAKLLDYGVKPNEISEMLDIRSRKTTELLAKVLPSLTFDYEGKVAHITITNDLYDSYPRYTEGVEVAVMFKAVEPEVTRVSMRSSNVDVASVALSFGGGGHLRAAGCTMYAPVEEAKAQLLAAIGKAL